MNPADPEAGCTIDVATRPDHAHRRPPAARRRRSRALGASGMLLAALALAPAAPAAAADGCDVTVLKNVVRGSCELASLFPKVTGRFIYVDRYTFPLPNLVPDGMHYFVNDRSASVAVDIDNLNTVGAFAHEVIVVLSISQQGLLVDTIPLRAQVAGVLGGGSTTVALGNIALPDRTRDIDIVASIVVDPPTTTRARGTIVETSETDNSLTRTCRVYGRVNPDTSRRACN